MLHLMQICDGLGPLNTTCITFFSFRPPAEKNPNMTEILLTGTLSFKSIKFWRALTWLFELTCTISTVQSLARNVS